MHNPVTKETIHFNKTLIWRYCAWLASSFPPSFSPFSLLPSLLPPFSLSPSFPSSFLCGYSEGGAKSVYLPADIPQLDFLIVLASLRQVKEDEEGLLVPLCVCVCVCGVW